MATPTKEQIRLSEQTITTEADAKDWLRQLVETGLDFHLDDEADDIWDGSFGKAIERQRLAVWELADPWKLIDADQTLSGLWAAGR